MEAFFWYGIALLSVVVALVLRRARSKINSTGRWVAGHIQHRVLVSRGSWSSVTIGLPDAIVLSLFLAANAILSLSSQNIANLAVLNMLPLFLGGRTNVQADYLGMSLPIYQLTHHWLARVFAVQGLLHSGLSFSRADGAGRAAGVAAAGLIIASLVASLLPVRRWSPTLFRWVHLVLSLTILCGVGIHTVLMTGSFASFSSILCFVAAGLLGASWILRLGRQLYQGPAEVVHYEVLHNAIRLWVRVRHGIPTHSGTYFYVRFPNLSLRAMFQSRLTPVAFWKTASRGSTKDISFIVPHSKDLATYLRRGRPLDLRLDGPYGEQLGLEQYELVVLVADGEGIAGVISLALSILSRRKWDEEDKTQGLRSKLHCDKTRKVDLVWKLQDNAQVEWASPYFTALSEIEFVTADERKKKLARVSKLESAVITYLLTCWQSLLMVWVLYPDEFEPGVHVPREKAWIECQTSAEQYPDLLSGLILKESSRTPGESIILSK